MVDKIDLGQAEQNCSLNCTYDQLFVLHCTADWRKHGLSIVNKFQKVCEITKLSFVKLGYDENGWMSKKEMYRFELALDVCAIGAQGKCSKPSTSRACNEDYAATPSYIRLNL